MVRVDFLRRPFEQGLPLKPRLSWRGGEAEAEAKPRTSEREGTPSPSCGGEAQAEAKPRVLEHEGHRSRAGTEDSELQRALAASAELFQAVEGNRADARRRLTQAVELYRAKVHPVEADGNCQFRALSVALCGNEDSHGALRARVVQQLRAAPEHYAHFVHEPYAEYLERMGREGQWGDNVTLQAASDALGCAIRVITDNPEIECVMVSPLRFGRTEGLVQQPLWSVRAPLCVTFLTELHYDAAFIVRP